MRVRTVAIVLAALVVTPLIARKAYAQTSQLPVNSLQMSAGTANVWSDGQTSIVELHGPVRIELDHTTLTAENAVVWLQPQPGALLGEQQVDISLMGDARLRQHSVLRLEKNLLVQAIVSGEIRLTANRIPVDDHRSDLYLRALALREGRSLLPPTTVPAPEPATEPTTQPMLHPTLRRRWSETPPSRPMSPPAPPQPPMAPKQTFQFDRTNFDRETTPDGHFAAVLTGGATIQYRNPKGDLLEFQARNAVLFTNLPNLQAARGQNLKNFVSEHITGAYFEGDVRVYVTPTDTQKNQLRMEADHVYYDFQNDRAVLTDVVFHSVDVKHNIPIWVRAQTLRQLSDGEYKANNVELTTSAFATPTYALHASQAYIRSESEQNPEAGQMYAYSANDVTLNAFGVPVFYLPGAGGTLTNRGGALRGFSVSDDTDYGYNIRTQWGLFESLGQAAPKDLDASYRLDYFEKRGPAAGLDTKYQGGFISETTKDPWNFLGDLHSYFVYDHGFDDLGGARPPIKPPEEFRGRAYLQHQHFFPDDWQAQIRLGWLSDPNFMTQWFNYEYWQNLPIDESIYLKHQHDDEVFTLLAQWQPNHVISSADFVQEQREVEHLPEVGYYRVGDSFADDHLTFFSENTAAGLEYSHSGETIYQQGLGFNATLQPGLPSYAYTGDPGDRTWRGDFRQEIDWPINAGPFKAVPYVFGRYTAYSQGVVPPAIAPVTRSIPTTVFTSSDQNRLMAGAGLRLTTTFWKVDNAAESDLFDIHRLRHIVEPELDLFTSAQTIDQNRLPIYDEDVDAINDVQSLQLALRQRWQTKRGGPGRWRSVDFFTLNIYGDFFANQPEERFRDPSDFRGYFLSYMPEASIPRNSINADAQWRISDTTAVLADLSHNLDHQKLATASIGLAVQRGDRLSYFIGNRYIADINSNITTLELTYQLTREYSLSGAESFDFGQSKSVYYSAYITRNFDRFAAAIRVYYDQTTNNSGVSFSLQPFGLARTLGSDQLQTLPRY